ncbi:MAG: carboxylating nicotinate-nucleotide diphosphorylase [Deltaproteobacteria bacterium]|nr:carboxylating nicotinate-nucleotide diphosphorylase [Deltaproteobacteria bacterium]
MKTDNKFKWKLYVKEDSPKGDITSLAIFPKNTQKIRTRFIAKEDCVLSGWQEVQGFLKAQFPSLKLQIKKQNASAARRGQTIAVLTGPVVQVLEAERTCLNLLQQLSGVATLTQVFVKKAKPHKVAILDTRKTVPGYREEQKLAVTHGGGQNHRFNLSDQYLIKDNHIDAAGSISAALKAVYAHKKKHKLRARVEIEVRDQKEFTEALALKPDIILLDNMTPAQIKKLVLLREQAGLRKKVLLEVSGGVTLKTIDRYLPLGIDRISLGCLTHSARAVDISLLF